MDEKTIKKVVEDSSTIMQIVSYVLSGGLKREIEAELGRPLTPEERMAFDRARLARRVGKSSAAAASSAERVRRHVAARNELPPVPEVKHRRIVAKCRHDLRLFGCTFCRTLLDHEPSDEITERLILKLQQAILTGGQLVVEFTRGAGKTTWVTIALVWALLYGHRRFPVCIAASKQLAKSIKRAVLAVLETSDEIYIDFPAVPHALRAIGGVVQRGAALTYRGESIGYVSTEMMFRLPMLRDSAGNPLSPACGAYFACRGVGASVRGLNELGERPDFILFDDPQTQKDARSNSSVERLDTYIHGDALGLAANTDTMAAFVTITPQRDGDLACRLANKELHPNWSVTRAPLILQYPPDWEKLSQEFVAAFHLDAAADDFARTESTAWYRAHAAKFAACRVLDPQAFDKLREIDAVHHALNRLASMGREAFMAECQMEVSSVADAVAVSAEDIRQAVNGADEWTLPPGTDCAVASCDINTQAGMGLSWVVVAFGPGRVSAVVAYGRYPTSGALVPPNASDLVRKRKVAEAISAVTLHIAAHPLRNAAGKAVHIRALGFDRGYLPEVVCRSLYVMRARGGVAVRSPETGKDVIVPVPFQLSALRGMGWSQYGKGMKATQRGGDHVYPSTSEIGDYLAVHVPYWREIAQSGFREIPLMPGSTSIWGRDSVKHYDFALEVAAERLVRKYLHPSGILAWDYATTGANHYCDALVNAFALGSYFHCFSALGTVIDSSVARVADPESMALFDPRQNTGIHAAPVTRPVQVQRKPGRFAPTRWRKR